MASEVEVDSLQGLHAYVVQRFGELNAAVEKVSKDLAHQDVCVCRLRCAIEEKVKEVEQQNQQEVAALEERLSKELSAALVKPSSPTVASTHACLDEAVEDLFERVRCDIEQLKEDVAGARNQVLDERCQAIESELKSYVDNVASSFQARLDDMDEALEVVQQPRLAYSENRSVSLEEDLQKYSQQVMETVVGATGKQMEALREDLLREQREMRSLQLQLLQQQSPPVSTPSFLSAVPTVASTGSFHVPIGSAPAAGALPAREPPANLRNPMPKASSAAPPPAAGWAGPGWNRAMSPPRNAMQLRHSIPQRVRSADGRSSPLPQPQTTPPFQFVPTVGPALGLSGQQLQSPSTQWPTPPSLLRTPSRQRGAGATKPGLDPVCDSISSKRI